MSVKLEKVERGLATEVVGADVRVLSVPLDPIIITANYTIPSIEMVLVRLRDADGVNGYGCLWCFGVSQANVFLSVLEYVLPLVVGLGPSDVPLATARIRRSINFIGYKGASVAGLSAADMALHDLLCRRLGVSLSSLLGRRRTELGIYWSGFFLNQSVEDLVKEADDVVARGYRAIKVRVGKRTVAEDIHRLESILARVPDGTKLMLDAVQEWGPEEAIRRSDRFAAYAPVWLEDPVPHNDYVGLRRVVERSAVPIATGENEYLLEGFTQLAELRCPYLLADMQRVGGIREWVAVAALARAHSQVLTPHVFPHVAVQLCAGLDQEEVWVEHVPWWDSLIEYPLEISEGNVRVPDVVGVGFAFVEEEIERRALGPWRAVAGNREHVSHAGTARVVPPGAEAAAAPMVSEARTPRATTKEGANKA